MTEFETVEIETFSSVSPLPEPAPWFWRLFGVRHVRAAWLRWCVERHYAEWSEVGALPVFREYDDRCIEAIWRGEL